MFDEEAIPTEDVAPSMESGAPQEQASPGVESSGVGDGTPAFEGGVPTPRERPKSTGAIQDMTNIANEGGVGPDGPIKRIISYLMGADAASPQEVDQRSQAVDRSGRLPASARNVMSVAAAAQEDPEAAWRLVQGHRMQFNAKQAFAYAALNGTAQKPPDIEAAIDAANKAQSHVLDGSEVRFAAGPRGVTATVMTPDGQPQRIQMSPDQFRSYLNVGGEGQFDKLMEHGVPAAIQKLATGKISKLGQMQPLRQQGQGQRPPQQEAIPTADEPVAEAAPAPRQPARPDPNEALQLRAQEIYPWASQGAERSRWMAQEATREGDRAVRQNVADVNADSRLGAASVRADAGVTQQGLKNQGAVATQEVKNKGWARASEAKENAARLHEEGKNSRAQHTQLNDQQKLAIRPILEKLKVPGYQPTPEEQKLLDLFNRQAQAPQQQAPQAPQQQAQQGKPPEPGARFFKGAWYRRGQNGEAVRIQ